MSANIIKINRGDSFTFGVKLPNFAGQDTVEAYDLKATDALYFALLYPHQRIEEPSVPICRYCTGSNKELDEKTGEIIIRLSHNDTKYLTPGVYYYTIKLHIGGSLEDMGASIEPKAVYTVIERTKFIVNE